jgi:hypothetical protein
MGPQFRFLAPAFRVTSQVNLARLSGKGEKKGGAV